MKKYKRLSSLALALLMLIALLPVTETPVRATELGSPENPIYISSAEELDAIRYGLDKHYILMADIDLKDNWYPIGSTNQPFTGTFDGNWHTIQNLTINASGSGNYGLFGNINNGATIRNLQLKDVHISVGNTSGSSETGALVGYALGGSSIENCLVQGSVSGANFIGGLAGVVSETNTKISQCHAEVTVEPSASSNFSAGGLVGALGSGACVSYSSADGSVTGYYVGGLVGLIENSEVEYSYSICKVNGGHEPGKGGLIGYNNGGEVKESYYDSTTSGQSDTGKGTPKSTTQMQDPDTFSDWTEVWHCASGSYPALPFQLEYSVTYDLNDAVGEPPVDESSYFSFDSVLAVSSDGLEAPVGKIFKEWNSAQDGSGMAYPAGKNFGMPHNDLTLYAIWADTYRLTYNANGGSGPEPAQRLTFEGDEIPVAEPASLVPPEGKRFKEWNTASDGSGIGYDPADLVIMPAADLPLYAIWADTYRLTYNANGGSGTVPAESLIYEDEEFPVAEPASLVPPEGKRFKEWNTASDGSGISYTPLDFVIMPAADLTLYAIWTDTAIQTEMLIFDAEEGAFFLDDEPVADLPGWTFDRENGILTLDNFTWETAAPTALEIIADELIIHLAEDSHNTIISTYDEDEADYSDGIYMHPSNPKDDNAALTIQGTGSLTVQGGKSIDESTGIYMTGNLTIKGGTVTAAGGVSEGESTGIYVDGDLSIKGGTVTATSGAAENCYGILSENLEVTGGTTNVTSGVGSFLSYGVFIENDASISHGSLTTTSGYGEKSSAGLFAVNILIESGTVTVTGGDSGYGSAGMVAMNALLIKSGTVTAKAGEVSGEVPDDAPGPGASFGIGSSDLTIEGGTVTASGNSYAMIVMGVGDVYVTAKRYTYWTNTEATDVGALGPVNGAVTRFDNATDPPYKYVKIAVASDTGTGGGGSTPPSNNQFVIPSAFLSGQDKEMTFDSKWGNFTVASNILSGLYAAEGKRVVISIGEGDKNRLPDDMKAAIGNRPLLSITLTIDGKAVDWSNPNAPVKITIPYTPSAEELLNPESIVIWYIDKNGNAVIIPNGHYDAQTKTVTFYTTHFSDFAVAYNPVQFKDVAKDAWYHKAVSAIAARKITLGTGDGSFEPDAKLTRGDFLVLLMRTYGIEPDISAGDNFTDAGDTYYTGYLKAAKTRGITAGVGDNKFAPEKAITRQEMFTLLYNILKAIGQLPEDGSAKALPDFSDADQIAPWASEAMSHFVKSGHIEGSGGQLDPTGQTTRAQMAQVLYKSIF